MLRNQYLCKKHLTGPIKPTSARVMKPWRGYRRQGRKKLFLTSFTLVYGLELEHVGVIFPTGSTDFLEENNLNF